MDADNTTSGNVKSKIEKENSPKKKNITKNNTIMIINSATNINSNSMNSSTQDYHFQNNDLLPKYILVFKNV